MGATSQRVWDCGVPRHRQGQTEKGLVHSVEKQARVGNGRVKIPMDFEEKTWDFKGISR